MFETKNVLMLVLLSGGILTGLTGTMIQAAPVYADTEDCEDNDDENCNTTDDRAQKITQENNCSADSGSADSGANGGPATNDNRFVCTNTLLEPNTGNDAFNAGPIP